MLTETNKQWTFRTTKINDKNVVEVDNTICQKFPSRVAIICIFKRKFAKKILAL